MIVTTPGIIAQLRMCKDSCRCQDYYPHSYQILQHRVQVRFLAVSLDFLAFCWMQGLWQQRPCVNNNTEDSSSSCVSLPFYRTLLTCNRTAVFCIYLSIEPHI